MKPSILGFCLIWGCIAAASTTKPVTGSTTTKPLSATTPFPSMDVSGSTETTGTIPSSTTKVNHNELLRKELSISPVTHRLRGRVVLANTRVEGSDEWGVSSDQAEVACDRIARYQSESNPPSFLLHTLLRRFIPTQGTQRSQPMEGHLLSVGSGYEVMALSRLLNPLPKGSYWTGGKLTRYRVNNMRHPGHTDHIVLTWTDGRAGRPSVLGMTKLDEQQLREGFTYCLALNLREAAWQARDCSDLLPYACLVTPRQVSFSNQASRRKTTEAGMLKTTESMMTGETDKNTDETNRMTTGMPTTKNLLDAKMTTGTANIPGFTRTTQRPWTTVSTSVTETEQDNLLAEVMTTTSSSTLSEIKSTSSNINPTTTKSNLLDDAFTLSSEVDQVRDMEGNIQKMTTMESNVASASGTFATERGKSVANTPRQPMSSYMTTTEPPSDKMRTRNVLTGTAKLTPLHSGTGVQNVPDVTTPVASRKWEDDEETDNDEDQ